MDGKALTFNEVGFPVASPHESGIKIVGDSFETLADLPHVDQVQVVELPVVIPLSKQQTVRFHSSLQFSPVQSSSRWYLCAQKSPYGSTPSLSSFSNVSFETVLMFV